MVHGWNCSARRAAFGSGVPVAAHRLLWVWLYFLLGQAWQAEIDSDDRLPFLTARLIQPRQVQRLRQVLRNRGVRLVVMARFAIFPTGMLAAAAGASDMPPRRFFPADGVALLVASGLVVGAGYGLGLAEHQSEVWITVAGALGLVALSGTLTWYLRRDPKRRSGASATREKTA